MEFSIHPLVLYAVAISCTVPLTVLGAIAGFRLLNRVLPPADQQPVRPTAPTAPTAPSVIVMVPYGMRRWQQLDAIIEASPTPITRHTAEQYLLTGKVQVVEQ